MTIMCVLLYYHVMECRVEEIRDADCLKAGVKLCNMFQPRQLRIKGTLEIKTKYELFDKERLKRIEDATERSEKEIDKELKEWNKEQLRR